MTNVSTAEDGSPSLDGITIAGIAIIAYVAANLLHEAVGHGGACLLVGGRTRMLNAVFFDCNETGLSSASVRVVAAGGSIVNVAAAALLAATAKLFPPGSPAMRFFVWLLTAVNLLTACGYLLFSGIGGFGDWAMVIDGLHGHSALRLVEIGLGAVLYFAVVPRLLQPGLEPFLGSSADRAARASALSVRPYFVGGIVYVGAGLLNPLDFKLVLLSAAAASFGGTSLLAWYFVVAPRRSQEPLSDAGVLGIPRRPAWIAAAAVSLVIFVGVLGRGIRV